MDLPVSLIVAFLVTIMVGVTLIATYQMFTQKPKPECAYCRCPYESHALRFGERGQCGRCRVCTWYASELS